jgi:amino acid transporter
MSASADQRIPDLGHAVFTRASSGLVRQVSTLDTLFYGMMQIGIPYVVFIIASWVNYPGASMELATIATIVASIFLGITYALYSSVYPRSGGEYVFLSRTVTPAYGFVVSFIQVFWQAFYFGLTGAFWATIGWAPLFTTLGIQTGSKALQDIGSWFSSPWGIFLTGAAMVLFFGFYLNRGVKGFFTLQRWAVTIALISVLAVLIDLALTAAGVLNFKANFDALAGSPGAYEHVISGATAAGTNVNRGFDLGQTLAFVIWPAFSILFAINSVSFSGEIKNVRRGQLVGITGAMLVTGVILTAMMFFLRLAVGDQFLIAASATPAANFPLPISPWVNLLASVAGGSPILTVLFNLYVLLLIPYAGAAGLVYSSRALMAWGLDGIGPEWLANVSDRYHSPGNAILVSVIIALGALTVYAFTSLLAVLSGLLGFALAFCLTSLAAIVFPSRRPEAFESSPAAMRVGGVPLMTISAVIASAFLLVVIWRAVVDNSFGANTTFSLAVNGAVVLAGIVFYFVARAIRSGQGLDVAARYREMPVE